MNLIWKNFYTIEMRLFKTILYKYMAMYLFIVCDIINNVKLCGQK